MTGAIDPTKIGVPIKTVSEKPWWKRVEYQWRYRRNSEMGSTFYRVSDSRKLPVYSTKRVACFSQLLSKLYTFKKDNGQLPKYIHLSLDWDLHSSYTDPSDVEFYLKVMSERGFFGNSRSYKNKFKHKWATIANVGELSPPQLYFILCNYRNIVEHPKIVCWVTAAVQQLGLRPSLAIASGILFNNWQEVHNYTSALLFGDYGHHKHVANECRNGNYYNLFRVAWKIGNILKIKPTENNKISTIMKRTTGVNNHWGCRARLSGMPVPEGAVKKETLEEYLKRKEKW